MEIKVKIGRKICTVTEKAYIKYYSPYNIIVKDINSKGDAITYDMSKSQFEKFVKEKILVDAHKNIVNNQQKVVGKIFGFDFDKLANSAYAIQTKLLYRYNFGSYTYALTVAEYEVSEEPNSYIVIGRNERVSKNNIGSLNDSYGDWYVYLTERNTEYVKQLIKKHLDAKLASAKAAYERAVNSYNGSIEALNAATLK